jgi:Fe-S cluster assembly protein SufD
MNIPAVNLEVASSERAPDVATRIAAYYHRAGEALPGHAIASVQEMREEAIAAFTARGLPSRRVEEWKYTDLRRLMTEAYAPAATQAELSAADIDTALGKLAKLDAHRLVFIDGHFNHALSTQNGLPSGITLTSLAQALYAPVDWVLSTLGKTNPQADDVVAQINTALMTDGFALHLSEGKALDKPLLVVNVTDGEAPLATVTRNLIVAEPGAEATVIEAYLAVGDTPAQINAVTEVKAGAGARIRHYKVVAEGDTTQHLASTFVELADESDYLAVNFTDGGTLSRQQTFLRFAGSGARGHFYGAQLLEGRQHCDMTLVIDHDAVGCESREHVKAVLDGHAHGVFQAKVIVRPDAQQTDGRQMAQCLLLDDDAEFDAKPELEIYADDVKCNHGATFGSLDEDHVFYLKARGISEEEARSLLIQAFLAEVFDHIEHEGLREILAERVAARLA